MEGPPDPEPWLVKYLMVVFGTFAAVLLVFFARPAWLSMVMQRRIELSASDLLTGSFGFILTESDV